MSQLFSLLQTEMSLFYTAVSISIVYPTRSDYIHCFFFSHKKCLCLYMYNSSYNISPVSVCPTGSVSVYTCTTVPIISPLSVCPTGSVSVYTCSTVPVYPLFLFVPQEVSLFIHVQQFLYIPCFCLSHRKCLCLYMYYSSCISPVSVCPTGSGVGRLLAVRLAHLGCRVVLWDVNQAGNEATADLIREAVPGAHVWTYTVDLAKREQIYHAAKQVKLVQKKCQGNFKRNSKDKQFKTSL